jgi:hypothetical protein
MTQDDAELTLDVQIANLFYEAEDLRREEPSDALTKFAKVLELGGADADSDALSSESRTAVFKSAVYIVILHFQMKQADAMLASYDRLLALIPRVTRNEAADAIDSVLNAVSDSDDAALLARVYDVTRTTLRTMPDSARMLFDVNLKLCKAYLGSGHYAEATAVLQQLHTSCQLPDGGDDKEGKGSEVRSATVAM